MGLIHPGPVARTVTTLAAWLVIIALSPAILLAGEPVNRYVMRRLRWRPPIAEAVVERTDEGARVLTPIRLTPASSLFLVFLRNPLWIVLTAPGRWVADQFTLPA